MLFSYLPTDIIHYILSYNETLKHRNGKYMGQISKSDKRYELLLKIPRTLLLFTSSGIIILRVNDILTIKIYIHYYLQLSRYTYVYFFGKQHVDNIPPHYTLK